MGSDARNKYLKRETLHFLLESCFSPNKDEIPPVPLEKKIPYIRKFPDSLPEPFHFRKFPVGELKEGGFVFAWRDREDFNVFSLMEDSDPYNDAEMKNDKTWTKGDVMELFLQMPGTNSYYEFHIAPGGATMELRIPDSDKLHKGEYKFEELICSSGMRADAINIYEDRFKGWAASISVPLEHPERPLTGARFCVCRYNYNRSWGNCPELSSTTEFTCERPSFHELNFWHKVI